MFYASFASDCLIVLQSSKSAIVVFLLEYRNSLQVFYKIAKVINTHISFINNYSRLIQVMKIYYNT